ncbi:MULTISPECIES: hypothetical protein [Methylomonas]|uniref:hypothetical protein n=1 Tax=Methylomonas TaxID=416 RepID=UPI0012323DF9|nr:hypothetical protein [Methylomonas rhizoryzae]
MQSVSSLKLAESEISQLHAATCLMMTRFISGNHCPKLAHVIVHQLQQLLAHPVTQQLPDSLTMYNQLLQHWQHVSSALADKEAERKAFLRYH